VERRARSGARIVCSMGGLWTRRAISRVMSLSTCRQFRRATSRTRARATKQRPRNAAGLARPAGVRVTERGRCAASVGRFFLRLRAQDFTGLPLQLCCRAWGGLPGYGSLMRWLPEYGVGVIGMANLTYSPGWGGFFSDAIAALDRTGALKPRVVQPSPALLAAQNDVSQLIAKWDDALAQRIAPTIFFWMSRPRFARRASDLSHDARRLSNHRRHRT